MLIKPQPGPQDAFARCPADWAFFASAPGSGKLLPLTTMLPTPTGWVSMTDVAVGDIVFDLRGAQCTVTAVFDVETPDVSYKLTFDDYSEEVCADTHLWLTNTDEDRKNRRPLVVRTTEQIVQTLKRSDGGANHSIPVCGPVQLPKQSLPIDPYILGLWLGDGSKGCGNVTTMDEEIADAIGDQYHCTSVQIKPGNRAGTFAYPALARVLKSLKLLNNKHIPDAYLRASVSQRRALLQGLVDTDGHVDPNKHSVEFSNTNPVLAHQFHELACSLGLKATIREGVAKLYGRAIGPKWRVCFSSDFPPCRLSRKLTNWRPRKRPTTWTRYILQADRVPSVPMRCISVDSADRSYLIGKSWIATHNSYALCLEALRHHKLENYTGALLRAEYKDLVRGPTSLWGTVSTFGRKLGGHPRQSPHPTVQWQTEGGGSSAVLCLHGNTDNTTFDGLELAFAGFDEADHFDRGMVEYIAGSRMRTTSKVRPYVRFSCMPKADTWVHELAKPWLDSDGYAKEAESGKVRWFFYDAKDKPQIFDTEDAAKEAATAVDSSIRPRSLAFVFAKTTDNLALMKADPGYLDRLAGLPAYERKRLLHACWEARPETAGMFDRGWFEIIEAVRPKEVVLSVRGWDLAATKPSETNRDPDWSRGVRLGKVGEKVGILDVVSRRDRPGEIDNLIMATVRADGRNVTQAFAIDPGAAGIRDEAHIRSILSTVPDCGPISFERAANKQALAKEWASFAERCGMFCLNAAWRQELVTELEAFPTGKHDDIVDAISYAWRVMAPQLTRSGVSSATMALMRAVR